MEQLLAVEGGSPGELEQALIGYSDTLLETVEEVLRGPTSDIPVEEVWHWLSSFERLGRLLSFVDHPSTQRLTARVKEGPTGEETLRRWTASVKLLRQTSKECEWNARYLRVVEEPLARLLADEVVESGALPGLVKTVMKSLHRIHCASQHFREHRTAPLLGKVLKALLAQASASLVPPYEAAAPPQGFEVALWEVQQLQEAFQAYEEHFFLDSGASHASSPRLDRRPATAPGPKLERASSRRMNSGELGWWKATARTSAEHAAHCQSVCSRTLRLLELISQLSAAIPDLHATNPLLLRDVEGFLQLHSGLKEGEDAATLLDLKRRIPVLTQLSEVEERVTQLLRKVAAAGVRVPEPVKASPSPSSSSFSHGAAGTVVTSSGAEVLTLEEPQVNPMAEAAALKESIESMKEDLQRFGSQLDSLSSLFAPRAAGSTFSPLPRRAKESAAGGDSDEGNGADAPDEKEYARAKEVAKRASWYKPPPPVLPSSVPVIEVQHKISQRIITRCPSRPRTAQPRLFISSEPPQIMRPATTAFPPARRSEFEETPLHSLKLHSASLAISEKEEAEEAADICTDGVAQESFEELEESPAAIESEDITVPAPPAEADSEDDDLGFCTAAPVLWKVA